MLIGSMATRGSRQLAINGGDGSAPPRVKPLSPHLQELVDLLPRDEPVHRSTIEKAYGKTNYARRIRKIESEYGWKIERRRGTNGANDDWYIRRSDGPVRPQAIRHEVPKKTRLTVYERDGWRCQFCTADVSDAQDSTRPQCDHKVPADRGGSSKMVNLQTLCTQCNLKKRQACKHCTLSSCDGCPYAYPERYQTTQAVLLSQVAADKLAAQAERDGVPPAMIITQLLEQL